MAHSRAPAAPSSQRRQTVDAQRRNEVETCAATVERSALDKTAGGKCSWRRSRPNRPTRRSSPPVRLRVARARPCRVAKTSVSTGGRGGLLGPRGGRVGGPSWRGGRVGGPDRQGHRGTVQWGHRLADTPRDGRGLGRPSRLRPRDPRASDLDAKTLSQGPIGVAAPWLEDNGFAEVRGSRRSIRGIRSVRPPHCTRQKP